MVTGRRGSSIVHLLTIMFLAIVAVAFLVPTVQRTRCGGNRPKCQSNLSQIGKALLLYSNENKGRFPQTHYVPGAPISYSNDGVADANPFALPPTPGTTNNIPAAMFLLIRTQDMTSEVFTCPSSDTHRDLFDGAEATARSNFTGDPLTKAVTKNVAYSFVNVYPSTRAVIDRKYQTYITAFSSDFAIAADISRMSPDDPAWQGIKVGASPSAIKLGNSRNHDQDGQNVLYADGHAEFQMVPLCGTQNDNIYTANAVTESGTLNPTGRSGYGVDPQHAADSVLLLHQP